MASMCGLKYAFAFGAAALVASSASAAIQGISSVSLTPAVDSQVGMDGFGVGSTSYDSVSVATASPGGLGNSIFWIGGPGSTTGSPSDANTALDDAYISTGIFGTGTYTFDTEDVSSGDSKIFYVLEMGGNDDGIVVNALNASNTVLGSLTLNSGDYGTKLIDVDWNGNVNNDVYGTTFSISDFSGSLTSVAKIQIVGDSRIDVAQVGVATEVIPEPASMALVGLGSLMLVARRRKA